MTTPRPTAMTSRLNTGGYGVTVVTYDRNVTAPRWVGAFPESHRKLGILPWAFRVEQQGTVTPDGALTVEPESWAARHYRRAVMRGAGVYRWGLWAFLGARRAPGAAQVFTVPSGEHVEPHRVIVRGPDVLAPDLPRVDVGRVAPGQGLTLAGQRQRAVYYAQAVMRGAGVYQAHLWAMLAGRAQTDAAQVVEGEGAALRLNGPQVLDRFTPWGYAPPPLSDDPEAIRSESSDYFTSLFYRFPRFEPEHLCKIFACEVENYLDKPATRETLSSFKKKLERVLRSLLREAATLPQGPRHRAKRRAIWALYRSITAVLRRMVARRAPRPRYAAQLPAPLYARPAPPAAPLAPPALA